MKLLFVLSHELYLRNFSSVIKGLAARGHQVELAFTALRDKNDPALAQIIASSDLIKLTQYPARQGWWWPVVDVLRILRDFVHSLNPAFQNAHKMRERTARRVPRPVAWLVAKLCKSTLGRRTVNSVLEWAEWSIKCDNETDHWLQQQKFDAILVSPLIDMNYTQMELVKIARHRALACVCLVASWDNLTMKGQIQISPDGLVVWNNIQVQEAVELHRISRERIIAAGAQLYDQWFEMSCDQNLQQWCETVGGLDPDKATILYTGSSPFICPDEVKFFEQWYDRLRADSDLKLSTCNVLLRPHPLHAAQWSGMQTNDAGQGRLAIWPEFGEMPISDDQKQSYFNCLWHSNAVVGVNTSVFLEAGILGRSVFTFRNKYFDDTQQGTLHFAHVENSGLLKIADDLNAHMDDLAKNLKHSDQTQRPYPPFIQDFLRPYGVQTPAINHVLDAVEKLTTSKAKNRRYSHFAGLFRILIWPFAAIGIRPAYFKRIKKG